MGFVSVDGLGAVLTYNDYKQFESCYKMKALMQFLKLFHATKELRIEPENLHWGEELEYHLCVLDDLNNTCHLSCDIDDITNEYEALRTIAM